MTTFVHNDFGRLYREMSLVGRVFIVAPEIASYLRKGAIFMREIGEKNLTVVDRDELQSEFTGLSSD